MSNPLKNRRLSEWNKKRRKTLQPMPVQYRARVRVSEGSKTTLVNATASSTNALRDINKLRTNAEIQARYVFIQQGFSSIRPKHQLLSQDYNLAVRNITTEIISEELVYLVSPNHVSKRENIGGKYYNVVRDKSSGKQISKSRWKNNKLYK